MELQVLMVDDQELIIEGYKSILSFNPFGYKLNTTEGHSCKSAYKLLTEENRLFDIVFLDLTLPPYLEKNLASCEDLIPIAKKPSKGKSYYSYFSRRVYCSFQNNKGL